MTVREFFSNKNGFTIAGLEQGNSEESPILCLHGWLDNAASFLPLFKHLQGRRLIAIDWPGHGHSSHRGQDAHYHFYDYVYDLLNLFVHEQWTDIDIIGHSMGGMIASAFCAAFPEKVKSLTLVDSIGFVVASADKTTEQLREGMMSRIKLQEKKKPIHPSKSSAIAARKQVSDLSIENATILCERGLEKIDESGFTWRADSRLRNISPYRLTPEQAVQLVKDIKVPVQLVYGSNGMPMIKSAMAQYQPLFSDIIVHQLEGGHHVHMEQPEKLATLINAFLSLNK